MNQEFVVNLQLGHVQIVDEWRWSPDGKTGYGGGFKLVYDEHGALVEKTEWEPTGCVIRFSDDEPEKPWWKFWG